ncbi:hypothetical protein ACIBQX_11755 [Nonomuraea sp. NPDC049714]|uniref:hypothetical protein n=1 Tax=Nonomuraea sp. NPDC049714 TaxID=3364357 RepID=UPI00379735C4
MNPRLHGQRVAALRFISDEVKAAADMTRSQAEAAFAAAHQESGTKSIDVTLDDGTPLGSIAIKVGKTTVKVYEPTLFSLVEEMAPGEIAEGLRPGAESDPELLAWVRENRPELLQKTIQPAYRAKVLKSANAKGQVLNRATGELVKVLESSTAPRSGAFAYTPCEGASEAVMDAWRRGDLAGVLADVLRSAIEAGEPGE